MSHCFKYVFLGLSITSSWGHGHATSYRALLKGLAARGHDVTFLERDLPFHADNRDLASSPYGRTFLYSSLEELDDRFADDVREADLVIVGSYIPDGIRVGDWVLDLAPDRVAFYDIDTSITIAMHASGRSDYVTREQITRYPLYLASAGGPTLEVLERRLGSPCARPLFGSLDPDHHYPEKLERSWDLGYLGPFRADRQTALDRLLLEPARRWETGRFALAGPHYPRTIVCPDNVERIVHVPAQSHRRFYGGQRFTLHLTPASVADSGWGPSISLFEAAACGTPIISDRWSGLEEIFVPDREILVADSTADVARFVRDLPEAERVAIGERARRRVLLEHTGAHRAELLERYTRELFDRLARRASITPPRRRARMHASGT